MFILSPLAQQQGELHQIKPPMSWGVGSPGIGGAQVAWWVWLNLFTP